MRKNREEKDSRRTDKSLDPFTNKEASIILRMTFIFASVQYVIHQNFHNLECRVEMNSLNCMNWKIWIQM